MDGVNGSDDNDGSSLETAYKTLQKGLDGAGSGGSLYVAPANYLVEESLISDVNYFLSTDPEHPERTRIIGAGKGKESYIKVRGNSLLAGFTVTNFCCSTSEIIAGMPKLSNIIVRSCAVISNYLFQTHSMNHIEVYDCHITSRCKLAILHTSEVFEDIVVSNCTVTATADSPSPNWTPALFYSNGKTFKNSRFIDISITSAHTNAAYQSVTVMTPFNSDFYNCEFINCRAICEIEGKEASVSMAERHASYSNCVIVACTMPISMQYKSNYPTNYNLVVSNCEGRFPLKDSQVTYYNSLFVCNTNTVETDFRHTGLFTGHFYNCTIVSNVNARYVEGSASVLSRLTYLVNTILYGNEPYDIASGNGVEKAMCASNVLYKTAHANYLASTLTDCIQADDVKFNLGKDPKLPYYCIRRTSPARDKGVYALNGYTTPTDLSGNPRVVGDEVDIGCYEWYQTNPGLHLILR